VAVTASTVQIYAANGQLILQTLQQVTVPGIQQLHINVSQLPCGLYIYIFENGQHISYGKFVKQ
jgi:hypothetical protein